MGVFLVVVVEERERCEVKRKKSKNKSDHLYRFGEDLQLSRSMTAWTCELFSE